MVIDASGEPVDSVHHEYIELACCGRIEHLLPPRPTECGGSGVLIDTNDSPLWIVGHVAADGGFLAVKATSIIGACTLVHGGSRDAGVGDFVRP